MRFAIIKKQHADPTYLAAQEALHKCSTFERYEEAKSVFDCIIEEHKDNWRHRKW